MKARTLSLVASLAWTAVTSAQTTDTPEYRVREAFTNLRNASTLWVRMDANETVGTVTTALSSDLFWAQGLTTPPTLELLDYRGAALTTRIVGDAVVLWSFDPLRNQYSTARYGVYGGNAPVTATNNLLQSLSAMTLSASSHSARLLREVYGGDAASYRHWVTGNPPMTVQAGNAPYTDPITGRLYTPLPTVDYQVFTQGNPVRRSAIFMRTRDHAGLWNLSSVYVAERDDLAGRSRLLDLQLTIYPNQVPNSASYTFVPPAGAKPVARSRPGG